MITIYKYPIGIVDEQQVRMPCGASIIHVGLDPQGDPCLWAQVDTQQALEHVTIFVVGTGEPFPEDSEMHLGSFVQGPFVRHVFIG
jgi:hypothetical protein